jgi:GntR family transcriptional regulator, transcriptional repressor for pyruvate dehydrogenase complex
MSEAIARQIEERVYRGELKPEEMLPAESELMRQFGVGRNTVREALRMLEASGLVKIRQGSRGGSVITHMSNEFVSDFLTKAFRLGKVSGEGFHAFRIAIEPSIAEIVASRDELDPKFIVLMEEKISEAKRFFESDEPTAFVNMDFHVLLAEATENMMFIVILKTLRAGLVRIAPARCEGFRQETIGFHERILQAVKDRDPRTARDLMHRHLKEIGQVVAREDFPFVEPA